jgi:hypothetical protein
MEMTMQYKTIVLELLQQRTQMHDQLRRERKLLPTMEQLARELKTSHQAWKEQLWELKPDSDPSEITSEALELAIRQLEDRLPPDSPPESHEELSLDGAMAFLRRHTSRG